MFISDTLEAFGLRHQGEALGARSAKQRKRKEERERVAVARAGGTVARAGGAVALDPCAREARVHRARTTKEGSCALSLGRSSAHWPVTQARVVV